MTTTLTASPTNLQIPTQHRFVVFLLTFMAGWPIWKTANIQYLEMFMGGHLIFLLFCFGLKGFKTQVRGLWLRPGIVYGLVMLWILVLSLSSTRLRLYEPMLGPYFLHYPLLVVVLRYIELFLVVFYSLYIAELMRRDPVLRTYGMRTYVNSAMFSIGLGMVGMMIFEVTKLTWMVNGEGRVQGGFPEGGPLGLYLLTVAMALRILWARRAISKERFLFCAGMLAWGLYYCRSKAAVFCALMIFITQIFFGHSWRQKLTSALAIGIVCGAAWWIFDVPLIWTGLMGLRSKAEVLALLNKADPNINYGRVAGSVIVPRMIAEHPWTGIGMGNYPVMRNDPKYLGLMMPVRNYDLAGVGLLGVAGELGIPALLALYGMMMYPAFRVYRTNGNAVLLTLALCQPYVHLMGAQITYFYPWLASAFVLSYLPLRAASKSVPESALARPSLGPALSGGMGAAG